MTAEQSIAGCFLDRVMRLVRTRRKAGRSLQDTRRLFPGVGNPFPWHLQRPSRAIAEGDTTRISWWCHPCALTCSCL